jgi:hypothetical protein
MEQTQPETRWGIGAVLGMTDVEIGKASDDPLLIAPRRART